MKEEINGPLLWVFVIYSKVYNFFFRVVGHILDFAGHFPLPINHRWNICWKLGFSGHLLATHKPYTHFFPFIGHQFRPIRFSPLSNVELDFQMFFFAGGLLKSRLGVLMCRGLLKTSFLDVFLRCWPSISPFRLPPLLLEVKSNFPRFSLRGWLPNLPSNYLFESQVDPFQLCFPLGQIPLLHSIDNP